jgi:hypothetical protein
LSLSFQKNFKGQDLTGAGHSSGLGGKGLTYEKIFWLYIGWDFVFSPLGGPGSGPG